MYSICRAEPGPLVGTVEKDKMICNVYNISAKNSIVGTGRSCIWRNCPKNCSKNAYNLYQSGMGDDLLYYLKNTRMGSE